MHEGRRPSCISFHLNVGRRPKGKDFGQWARVWNRRVARGTGLRYTRAKDLVKNRSTVAGLALPDVGAERILFFLGEGRVMNDRLNRKGAQPVWKSHEKTSAEKEAWLRPFEEDENLRMMDEETLAKARRYTEELCREDNVFALRLKGYACYGGNRLYECDWTAARDCMLRLRELADDAEYANTLGYIYYYGRCNGGEPEYEKAFPQFSYAAANGLFEAIYKLGDLYSHGYGCRKSEETAQNLYHMVYNETKKKFLRGYDASFADAALRLGKVFEYGIGTEANPAAATVCTWRQIMRQKSGRPTRISSGIIRWQSARGRLWSGWPGSFRRSFSGMSCGWIRLARWWISWRTATGVSFPSKKKRTAGRG